MEQYRREVPSGRRAWPASIKGRVLKLGGMGLRCAEISRRTGLPYYTVLAWRKSSASFVQLPVVKSEKVGTATVPTFGVTALVFPNGVRVEGLNVDTLKALLPALGVGQ